MCDLTNINHKTKLKYGSILIKLYSVGGKYFYQVKYPAVIDCYL
jgi:hypothetical protein